MWRYWQQEFAMGQQYATASSGTYAGKPSNTWQPQQQQQQHVKLIPASYPAAHEAAREGAWPVGPRRTAIVTGVFTTRLLSH
jgi:hypothetical protein